MALITSLRKIRDKITKPLIFGNSGQYWEDRYKRGGNSGAGSYDRLAEFKAEIINKFVKDKNISTVIEFGCGDGNQLKYFDFPSYTGYDVSEQAVEMCKKIFEKDKTKKFKLLGNKINETADLTLSLDVIYHLVEDEVYTKYMETLFGSSKKFVIIYSSNYDKEIILKRRISHVKHREFTLWIEKNASGFTLIEHIPNRYPLKKNDPTTTFADFYIFEKQD